MVRLLKRVSTVIQCSESFWRKASVFERMVDWVNERH
jgi:hypothetical protein